MAIAALDESELAGMIAELGLRRLDAVRMVVGPARTSAEVVGVGRRFPVRRRVSLRRAARLVEAGARLEMVHVPARVTR